MKLKRKINHVHLIIVLIIFQLFFINNLKSQGIVINEISNGISGTKEFIELLVIGSVTNPIGSVDINNWVIDDNNGDFEASVSAGVARGHYKFVRMPLLNPGDIIVIFNPSDLNINLPTIDETDSNNDGVYIIPINSVYIERCTSLPSSTGSTAYFPCTYSHSFTQTWSSIGFRNSGDAIQTRNPDLSFYHGFSYGDVLTIFPTFYNGNLSFNIATGSGTNKNYYLDCGDWTLHSNYQRGDAPFDTPGYPNTSDNFALIQSIKNGTFNYNNLSDQNNCNIILDKNQISIKYDLNNFILNIILDSDGDYNLYEIWESKNAIDFSFVGITYNNFVKIENYVQSKYFKVLGKSENASAWSNTIFAEHTELNNFAFPIPASKVISINPNLEIIECLLKTVDGKTFFITSSHQIDISQLPKSFYILTIKTSQGSKNLKLIVR